MDLRECLKEYIPDDILQRTKKLYDKAYKARSFTCKKSQALPELIIDGLDTEQIWQQIELENSEVLGKESLENISKLLASSKWNFLSDDRAQQSENSNGEKEKEEGKDEGKNNLETRGHQSEESEDDTVSDNGKRKAKQTSHSSKKKRKTEVDDKFFSLSQMTDYLTKMEKMETSGKKSKKPVNSDEDDDDDDMSIDLFNDIPEEDDKSGSDDEIKTGKSVKYNDFFDSPESENGEMEASDHDKQDDDDEEEDNDNYDENDNDSEHEFDNKDDSDNVGDEKEQTQATQKKVKFNLLSNSDDSDSEKEVDSQESKIENKSSFESRKERLTKKIEQLEQEAIAEKPWQLKGETTANTRPKNSLLEEFVEFDTGLRPAPIMTEKTTMKLEDIIRSRIKDKAWDDVEKKVKPVETPLEYKKKLVMNQEKSKESLAQIYENEYIKQREALTGEEKDEENKEEPPEHIEIREKMHSLFRKLDALSNFHYTPKLAKPEIKIVSNIPAINMEEVAPIGTSDATLLAPEEIKGKPKGDLLGKSERSKTDKKRERRKKKLKQHNRAVYQSKKGENDQKKNKKKSKVDEPKITGRNILNTGTSDQQAIKSSTAFFTKLQNEVTTGTKESTGMKHKKKATVR